MKAAIRKARRIAVHETGHLVMALILDLEVQRCAIVGSDEEWRPGELGRCTVLMPDPVGLKRFLVSMGGVMAENHFFGEDRGGSRDRKAALQALNNFLAHYRDRGRGREVETLFEDVATFFHDDQVLQLLEEGAESLRKNRVLEPKRITDLARRLPDEKGLAEIRERLRQLEAPAASPSWKETAFRLARLVRNWILRLRKPFDEGP